LLADLPETVDPCGERGEFHTRVYAGPHFARPLPLVTGERVRRDGRFEYCDVLLAPTADRAPALAPSPRM
jgi:diphthamide synthase (EF-2-diphthine--ammonia ligase)